MLRRNDFNFTLPPRDLELYNLGYDEFRMFEILNFLRPLKPPVWFATSLFSGAFGGKLKPLDCETNAFDC